MRMPSAIHTGLEVFRHPPGSKTLAADTHSHQAGENNAAKGVLVPDFGPGRCVCRQMAPPWSHLHCSVVTSDGPTWFVREMNGTNHVGNPGDRFLLPTSRL